MSISSISLFALLVVYGAHGAVLVDFNCTSYTEGAWKYTPAAVACEDTISETACRALYTEVTAGTSGWPTAGDVNQRPYFCYAAEADDAAPISVEMKTMALASCPKTCGLCCQTDAYSCPNVQFPRITCASITRDQCNSVAWRTIIAQDCPSACGFCNSGGCVDAVTNCGTDLSICQNIGMQDFVNQYCQRTCNRCPSTTASGSATSTGSSGSCTSYAADTSSSCASWAANGFCTNTFYTADQRRARCATTCRLC